jgi:RND superfamily putative drug exporter
MQEPIQVEVSADHHVALVSVPLAGSGQDATSNRALDTLRHSIIPATVGAVPGTHVNVAGETAGTTDFNTQPGQRRRSSSRSCSASPSCSCSPPSARW